MSSRCTHEAAYDTVQCEINRYHSCPTLLLERDAYFFIKRIEFFDNESDAQLARRGTVIDLSSRAAAERTLSIDTDNNEGLFGKYNTEGLFGLSEFDGNEQALSLKYSDSKGSRADFGSRVKFSLRLNNPYILKDNQSYMVITFKTNITSESGKIRLMMENYWGECITLESDVSVSSGEYVRTKPINIHVLDQPKQDYFDRLRYSYDNTHQYSNANLIYISSYDRSGVQTHPYFEILYNIEGTANVVVHAAECEMQRGDIVIVPPLCAHNVISKIDSVSFYSIKFQPEYFYAYGVPFPIMRSHLYAWQENIRNAPLIDANEAKESGIASLVDELIAILNNPTFENHVKIHAKLLTLFSIMLERFGAAKEGIFNPAASTSSFTRAIEEAQKNMYNFTTSDAARVSGLSYNYFCAGFKKAYGMSFSAYLDSLRLSESTRLLLTTDMSITDIAASLGFADTCHYIRKFKLAYNITPHKYRSRTNKYR